jgi:hypothetical protein
MGVERDAAGDTPVPLPSSDTIVSSLFLPTAFLGERYPDRLQPGVLQWGAGGRDGGGDRALLARRRCRRPRTRRDDAVCPMESIAIRRAGCDQLGSES